MANLKLNPGEEATNDIFKSTETRLEKSESMAFLSRISEICKKVRTLALLVTFFMLLPACQGQNKSNGTVNKPIYSTPIPKLPQDTDRGGFYIITETQKNPSEGKPKNKYTITKSLPGTARTPTLTPVKTVKEPLSRPKPVKPAPKAPPQLRQKPGMAHSLPAETASTTPEITGIETVSGNWISAERWAKIKGVFSRMLDKFPFVDRNVFLNNLSKTFDNVNFVRDPNLPEHTPGQTLVGGAIPPNHAEIRLAPCIENDCTDEDFVHRMGHEIMHAYFNVNADAKILIRERNHIYRNVIEEGINEVLVTTANGLSKPRQEEGSMSGMRIKMIKVRQSGYMNNIALASALGDELLKLFLENPDEYLKLFLDKSSPHRTNLIDIFCRKWGIKHKDREQLDKLFFSSMGAKDSVIKLKKILKEYGIDWRTFVKTNIKNQDFAEQVADPNAISREVLNMISQ